MEFIDPSLHRERRKAEIMRWVQIGLLCVQEHPEDRPSMWDVVLMLSCEDAALPLPKQPAYCKRDVTAIIPGRTAAATSNVPEPGPESERLAGCVMGTTLSLFFLTDSSSCVPSMEQGALVHTHPIGFFFF